MSKKPPCRCGVPSDLSNRVTCNRCFGVADAETLRMRLNMVNRYIEESKRAILLRELEREDIQARLRVLAEREGITPW